MAKFKFFVIAALTVAVGLVIWFWTPDTDFAAMQKKYAGSTSQFISLDGGHRIHLRDTGDANKPVLVMIHGTSDSLLTWNALTPLLQPHFRLISLDLPSHGFSSPLLTASFDEFIAVIVGAMDHQKVSSAILLGNSLGGGIAWRTALQHPERVERLILLSPSGAPLNSKPKSNLGFRLLGNPVGRFFGRYLTPRILVEKSILGSVVDPGIVDDAMIDRYWELLRLPGNREALMNLSRLPRLDSAWQDIGRVTQPTLVIWGDQDQLIPADRGPAFLNALPNAQLKTYENIGHMPMIEAPQRLAADTLDFLSTSNQ